MSVKEELSPEVRAQLDAQVRKIERAVTGVCSYKGEVAFFRGENGHLAGVKATDADDTVYKVRFREEDNDWAVTKQVPGRDEKTIETYQTPDKAVGHFLYVWCCEVGL